MVDFSNLSSFGGGHTSMPAAPTQELQPIKGSNQFFDFEQNKVQQITLEQLERTNKENRGDDRSCPHGIYHFKLLHDVIGMCNEIGYDADVYDLFATNNRDKQTPGVSLYPELEQVYGERAIEAHTLRRVYANIRLTAFDTDELTTNLAISYTQRGIQIGFGRMVRICHNMNMMGAGRFVSDYSITAFHYAKGDMIKTDLAGIMSTVRGWLSDAGSIVAQDDSIISRMKQSVLTPEQLYTLLGILVTIRVQCDSTNKRVRKNIGTYPLNQSQISAFAESLLLKQAEQGHITAWDFYNCATELYKPDSVDQNMILPQALSMSNFMRTYEMF